MKIPSLDKEFLLQHHDHEFALSIQWYFIESEGSHLYSVFSSEDLGNPHKAKVTWSFKAFFCR